LIKRGRNVIKEKSYQFALRIIKLDQYLRKEKKELVLSKQVLRSGTSIGALIRESEQAESKADFIHKMAVALKEANETDYWLNLLKDSNLIPENLFDSFKTDIDEILKLLTSIIRSAKKMDN
jgi:four helix bundle protein